MSSPADNPNETASLVARSVVAERKLLASFSACAIPARSPTLCRRSLKPAGARLHRVAGVLRSGVHDRQGAGPGTGDTSRNGCVDVRRRDRPEDSGILLGRRHTDGGRVEDVLHAPTSLADSRQYDLTGGEAVWEADAEDLGVPNEVAHTRGEFRTAGASPRPSHVERDEVETRPTRFSASALPMLPRPMIPTITASHPARPAPDQLPRSPRRSRSARSRPTTCRPPPRTAPNPAAIRPNAGSRQGSPR